MNKLLRLKNIFEDKGWKIFDEYADSLTNGLDSIMDSVKKFDMKPLVQGLGETGTVLKGFYDCISPFAPILPWIAGGWLLLNTSLKAFALIGAAEAFKAFGLALAMGQGPVLGMSFALRTLAGSLIAIWPYLLALGAIDAAYALWTGKDSKVGLVLQNLGVIPKLSHDEAGHPTGYANEEYNSPWLSKVADKRQNEAIGHVYIHAPEQAWRTTFEDVKTNGLQMHLLGVQ
jgi:hypothetical protein